MKFDVVFQRFHLLRGRGLATLILFLYVPDEAGRIHYSKTTKPATMADEFVRYLATPVACFL